MSAGQISLNIYTKSLSQSESPFSSRHQANQSLTNCPTISQNTSPISSNNGLNLMAKNTPTYSIKQQQQIDKQKHPQQQQKQLQQTLQASSILTTYPNSSCEGSSCGSSIKPLNGNNALSRQMSQQLSRHQQQTSNGSTCEQSELRSFFSDNQHFLSNNHFSGISAEERQQQHITQTVSQNSLQVSHFNCQSPFGHSPPPTPVLTIEKDSQEPLGTCSQHPTKKVKYQMSEHHQEKFCSNCAVEFARQGYGIQEISKSSQQQQKLMDLFMGEVKSVKALNDMLMACFNTKISSIREYCLGQAKKVNDLFVSIEREIFSQKTAVLTVINDHMWEAINVLESKKNEAKILEKRFLRNEADIIRNRQKIIEEMDEAEVSSILNYYQQELDQAKQNLNEILTGTQFQLASMDSNKLTNDPMFIKSIISKDIFQPIFLTSSLSNPLLFSPQQSNPQTSSLNDQKPNKNIITAQVISSRRQDSKQKFEIQKSQLEIEQQRVVETGGDSSMSEKQQTQESEDLSMIPTLLQNESKISNKSNISANKIISYTDLHYQSSRDNNNKIINPNHEHSLPNKVLDSFKQPTSSIKHLQHTYQSPPNSQKSEGQQFISIHKPDQQGMANKYKQVAQTEPTHLPCNKFKQILQGNSVATTNTGYQRHLAMNEENTQGNVHQNNNQNNNKIKEISQTSNKASYGFQ